jgi:hypothetical protein
MGSTAILVDQGVMEYWSDGVMIRTPEYLCIAQNRCFGKTIIPFRFSNSPILHNSNAPIVTCGTAEPFFFDLAVRTWVSISD